MFVAQFKDGSSFTENDGTWDECPDKGITVLHLTLPVKLKKIRADGKEEYMPSPTVRLENYDSYYFANEAINLIFRTQAGVTFMGDGKGSVIKQVIAGLDKKHDLVILIEVDKQANVKVKRFPIDKFTVNEKCLRKGYRQELDDTSPAIKKIDKTAVE